MCVCIYIYTHIYVPITLYVWGFFLVRISLMGLLCLSFKQQANMQGTPANMVSTFGKSQSGAETALLPP